MADNKEQQNQVEKEETPEVYLTRGALLYCDCGTHPRRLNLPVDHGVKIELEDNYEAGHPFVTASDCKVGDYENISYFGICQAEASKGEETIHLIAYTPEGEEPSAEVQTGPICKPIITGKWENTKKSTKINDGTTKEAVTSLSYLCCKKTGVIVPISSGLEYAGDKDE
jgi:hypothetical protein